MCQLLSWRTAFALVLVATLARGAAAQSGRVSGVVNDENGRPIKAGTVTAELPDTGQTFTSTTDDKGRFTMIGLRTGQWTFIAQAPGYAARGGRFGISSTRPNAPIAFVLERRGNTSGPLASITAKDLQAQLSAADALFNQSRWDDAIAAYRSILDKTPGLNVVYLQIAAAYLNKKDVAAATAAYHDLLKGNPGSEQAVIGLSTIAVDQGDTKTAQETLLKAAEGPAAGRNLFYMLGEVKLAQNDPAEAANWYRKAADADPSWGKALYKLGLLALKSGDTPSAVTLMSKVMAVDPESPEASLAKTAIDDLKK